MALWISATSPQSVGKVISVDGPAYLPALMNSAATVKSVSGIAATIRDTMAKSDAASFKQGQKRSLQSMITKASDVEWILSTSEKSDPKSVGEAMYELYTTDLRPIIGKIKSPVLMLAEGAFITSPDMEKDALASYESQIHAIPNHTLKMSRKAKHFIMLDDPEFYFNELDAFLK